MSPARKNPTRSDSNPPALAAVEKAGRADSRLPSDATSVSTDPPLDIPVNELDFNLDLMEELLTDGIAGFAYVDLNYNFVRLNQILASIYGMAARDLIDKHVSLMVGEIGWDRVKPSLDKASKGTTVLGIHACEDRPDDEGVIHQRVSSFFPVRAGGRIVGIAAVVHDVTDRVIAEQAVRDSEAKYRLLAESIPHFVWIIDREGRFLYANYRLMEYVLGPGVDTIDWGWLAFVDPFDRAETEWTWNEVREAGITFELECRLLKHDGSARWFHVRGVPMSDEKGCNIRWLGTFTDIHDQKQAEETRQFLDLLGERMRATDSPDEILQTVVTELGQYLGVSRCRYGENNWETKTLTIRNEYCAPGYESIAGSYTRSSLSPINSAMLASGVPIAMNDTETDPRTVDYVDFYRRIQFRAGIVAPIIRNGLFIASLSAGMAHNPRVWRDDEVALVKTVAERTWLAVENSRLVREKQQSDARQKEFVRDMLAVVTDGRLHVCESGSELPPALEDRSGVIDVGEEGGLRELRHAVLNLAAEFGFEDSRAYDLMTAASEAAMNALVHATKGRAWICGDGLDTIQVWIVDNGAGISVENLPRATLLRGYSTASTLGHGFKMIIGTTDRIHLLTNANGTTVVIEHFREAPEAAW